MGFRNQNTGYTSQPLSTRAIIKKGNFALIPQDGLVKNVLPGFTGCDVTILASPKLGATFVDYLVDMEAGGGNQQGFGGGRVEVFFYLLEGKATATVDGKDYALEAGSYLYCPAGQPLKWTAEQPSKAFLYKRNYKALPDVTPAVVYQNIKDVPGVPYEDMDDVLVYDLLPKDIAYDMNFHILSFKPGACHGYVETHVQEHGAYMLSGEGMYRLDEQWVPVQKGDYIFMGAYSPQAAYGIGRGEVFSYLYSKDCNRDEDLD